MSKQRVCVWIQIFCDDDHAGNSYFVPRLKVHCIEISLRHILYVHNTALVPHIITYYNNITDINIFYVTPALGKFSSSAYSVRIAS